MVSSGITKEKRDRTLKASAQVESTESFVKQVTYVNTNVRMNAIVMTLSWGSKGPAAVTNGQRLCDRSFGPGLWSRLSGLESKLYHFICCMIWGTFT